MRWNASRPVSCCWANTVPAQCPESGLRNAHRFRTQSLTIMQTILLADIPAQLWRNGAGLTRPIASGLASIAGRATTRVPAGTVPHLDAFDWRISLADIKGDGPFSAFPGIDRCAVLLGDSGITGITLSGPSGSSH